MTARILIVDDVAANLRLMEARLNAEYYQVACAQDGQGATGICGGWRPFDSIQATAMSSVIGFSPSAICRA